MRGAAVVGLVLVLAAGALGGPAARLERQGVALVLSVDRDAYPAGEPVHMELVVRNPAPGPVTSGTTSSCWQKTGGWCGSGPATRRSRRSWAASP